MTLRDSVGERVEHRGAVLGGHPAPALVRLARTRDALSRSGLGALLSFDQHNIRYTTSTVIGEWARDKLTRYSLLTGNGEPYIWDFGSAARHHKLYAPWLKNDHCRAGLLGMRGAVG